MTRLACVLAITLVSGCGASDSLEVTDAWVRQPPPGAPSAAGYFTLHNGLAETVRLTDARAAGYGHVMIHETRIAAGVATMHHVSPVDLAPGAQLDFRPGGLHLMLMHPQRDVAPGDTVEIELEFQGHAPLVFTAPMRAATD